MATTTFDELRGDLAQAFDAISEYSQAVNSFVRVSSEDSRRLWDEIAELRDGLLALSNRVESLIQAVLASDRDVADAVIRVNTSLLDRVRDAKGEDAA